MKTDWHILTPPQDIAAQLQLELGCSPTFARILANRRFVDAVHVQRYLSPSLADIRKPFAVKDMALAVERITRALSENEKIMIFGDYDVDGVTSTAILYQFLSQAGARMCYHIPHRISEGYGLQAAQVEDTILGHGIRLLITVDCGSASAEAIKQASAAGVDVIVTDHHTVGDMPSEAVAFVNPKRPDCRAGFEHLAGVGVVFMLLISLRKALREKGFWQTRPEPNLKSFSDLVALGSIADAVPLIAENRILTRSGLQILQAGHLRPGIDALFKTAGVDARRVNEEDLAFKVVPRLNAAGRMDHAVRALKLLTTADPNEARQLAESLDRLNVRRRQTEAEVLQQILETIDREPDYLEKPGLILAREDWHEGVVGIVAARLTERFHKPVAVISIRDGLGKGSARSIPGVSLDRVLSCCSEPLEGFGGHAMAAGLRVRKENLARFEQLFQDAVQGQMSSQSVQPRTAIDARLPFDAIDTGLIDEIDRMRPFGQENAEPVLMTETIHVIRSQIVGGRHLKLWLQQPHQKRGRTFEAIQFNVDPALPVPDKIDAMAYRLQFNYWNGKKTIQLMVEDRRDQA